MSLTDPEPLARAQGEPTSEEHKKSWGQFFTSPSIASFMASLLRAPERREVRILDPGAGKGVLGLAAAEALITRYGARVHLVAVEKESGALAELREASASARKRLGESSLDVQIVSDDFLDLDRPRLGTTPLASFDYAIANPPYFKMSPTDDRGGDAPNIYARFMEVTARMLRDDGELCFIIPRSYAAGYYFRPFRRRFHSAMRLDHAHLFESRCDAFRDDGVLQENIIVLYRRSRVIEPSVRISCSTGERDLDARFTHDVMRDRVLSVDDANAVLHLPTSSHDLRVMDTFSSWTDSLSTYGLDVSTGPIVPFRAEEFLRKNRSKTTVPVLWLQHVLPGRIEWPLATGFRKPEHIERTAPEKLFVENRTYVLLRRFSAKEDARRIVAAAYTGNSIQSPLLGLENHVNFIHRKRGELAKSEAQAIAALLNSPLYDAYFRISNGNTQVSATELRALPLPSPQAIEAITARMALGATGDDASAEVLGEA